MLVYLWPTGWYIICLILCCFINVPNYVYSNCGAILSGGGRWGAGNTTAVRRTIHGEANEQQFNLLKPKTYFMYHRVLHSTIPRSAHTVHLCVSCGSENKQRLFPYAALTDWLL